MKKIFYAVMILALMILANICVANAASAIQTWKIDGEYHITYPSVDSQIDESELTKYSRISDKINEVMRDYWNFTSVTGGFVNSTMDYEITCDRDNFLSMVFTVTMKFKDRPEFYEKDANGNEIPYTYKQTLNFDMRTGYFIEPENLKNFSDKYNFTLKDISDKLQAYAKAHNFELNPEMKDLQMIPQRYYIDENLHLHFIFGSYELSQKFKYYDFVDIDMNS